MIPPLQKKARLSQKYLKIMGLVLLMFVIAGAVFYGQLAAVRPGVDEQIAVDIKNGSTPTEIASELDKQGLIKNKQVFLIYARLSGKINSFKSGQYLLKPSLNIPQIVNILVVGKVATVSFTIPEGYHLRQIVETLVKKGIVTEEEFWREVKEGDFNYSFLKELPKTERRLEGYLFPDTYIIPKGADTKMVLDVMLKRFEQVYQKLPANNTGLSLHEIVTLASIVEGESMLDKERPYVASVFYNRLKIKMKLDSDATIQYLFDKRKERVLYKDLEIDSPYNTYRNRGLPPGPIGSPGEASLLAVLEPAKTDYFYFVAKKDNSGEHLFAATIAGHAENKRILGY